MSIPHIAFHNNETLRPGNAERNVRARAEAFPQGFTVSLILDTAYQRMLYLSPYRNAGRAAADED